jgi:Right handed beta helix region/Immunoglobulin domain
MHTPSLISNTRTLAFVVCSMLGGFSNGLWASPSPNTQFTVEVLSPNSTTRTLIETNASWRYFKGTSDPNAGWDTADEIFLGSAWGTGTAGFGYGDADDQTLLPDMQNGYSTLFLRATFSHEQVLDPRRLKLRIDYDDGFIAYLDGKEFARVNAPGEPGQRQPYNSLATASHEASRGPGGNRVETWYFGLDIPALFPHASEGGDLVSHVLAIQGLNRALGDDDFSLIPSLYLEKFFTEVTGSSVQLAGRITLVGATSVMVNGEVAAFDFSAGTWSKTHALKPGLNRLIIESRDCDGHVLASLTKDVLTKGTPRLVSGTLSGNASWDSANGVVELTGNVTVPAGVILNIAQGTTILFRSGTSLLASSGMINVNGSAIKPVYFLPTDGETPWDGFTVSGANSSLTLRFAEVVAGKIRLSDSATALLEDTIVRDYSYTTAGFEDYIAYALGNCLLTARRSVFSRYYTMAFGGRTTLHIDDCLFESSEHDFFKPQDTPADSYVRRCTFAHSSVAGTDGVDTGANAAFTVDNCLFYDIADKAISLEASTMTVSNCLMYQVGTGMAVKDDSTAILINNTIANSTYGIVVYLKNAGAVFAHAAVTNNIIWGNRTNISMHNPDDGSTSPNATIAVRNCNVEGGFTGTGNLNSDPRFANTANGDYRLSAGSPSLGTGVGGVNMGPPLPSGFSQPPILFQQPISQTAGLGSNVNFRVAAVGSPPLSYQWRFDDADIPGGTSSTLVLTNFTAAREGLYQVLVSNAGGSADSAPVMALLNDPVRIKYVSGDCRYDLRLSGPAGKTYILQTSINLVNWTPVVTNTASTGIVEVHDAGLATSPARFFRAASIP